MITLNRANKVLIIATKTLIYNFSRSHEEQDLSDVDDFKILGELIDKGQMKKK